MIVIQLSDPHIVAPGELLYGRVDTAEFLARSVAEINRLDPLPDVVVMTGDLVDHGNPAEYEHLRRLLAPLAMPIFVIPGNHDAREPLRAAFAGDGVRASSVARGVIAQQRARHGAVAEGALRLTVTLV